MARRLAIRGFFWKGLGTPSGVKDLVHNLVHTCIKTGSKRSQSSARLNAPEAAQTEVDIATSQTKAERRLTTDKGEVGGSVPNFVPHPLQKRASRWRRVPLASPPCEYALGVRAIEMRVCSLACPSASLVMKVCRRDAVAGQEAQAKKPSARSCAVMTYCAIVGAIGMSCAVSDKELSREILKTVAQRLKNPTL